MERKPEVDWWPTPKPKPEKEPEEEGFAVGGVAIAVGRAPDPGPSAKEIMDAAMPDIANLFPQCDTTPGTRYHELLTMVAVMIETAKNL